MSNNPTNTNSDIIVSEYLTIDPNINLQEFILEYPQLIDVLAEDYGFHCVNCMFSGFDTLKEGAQIHGIEGQDFEDMIKRLEDLLNSPESE